MMSFVRLGLGVWFLSLVACTSTTSNETPAGGGSAGSAGAGGVGGSAAAAGTGGADGGAAGTAGAGGTGAASGSGGGAGAGGNDGGSSSYCGPLATMKGPVCQFGAFGAGDSGVALLVDDTYVWWATSSGVRRRKKDGSSTIEGVSSPLQPGYEVGGLAFDGARICWTEENGNNANGFVRCRARDLISAPVTVSTGELNPQDMAADGTSLFWMNNGTGSTGAIRKVATGASAGAQDVITSTALSALAGDASENFVYFVAAVQIKRVGKDGNPTATVHTPTWSSLKAIALSKSWVYFPQADGIYRVDRKADQINAIKTASAPGVTAITVHDETVYWARSDNTISYEPVDIDLEKQLPALGLPVGLAADDESVYWITDGALAKTKLQ